MAYVWINSFTRLALAMEKCRYRDTVFLNGIRLLFHSFHAKLFAHPRRVFKTDGSEQIKKKENKKQGRLPLFDCGEAKPNLQSAVSGCPRARPYHCLCLTWLGTRLLSAERVPPPGCSTVFRCGASPVWKCAPVRYRFWLYGVQVRRCRFWLYAYS